MTYIDPCEVSPNHYRELFSNDRVVEMSLSAGEKDNEHSHPNETVYFIKGGKVRNLCGRRIDGGRDPRRPCNVPRGVDPRRREYR